MQPAKFDYVRATTPEEALAALAAHGGDARVLAGGQSLIPAMRYRLAQPAVLVDINPIASLAYIREDDGFLRIGAMTRDATLERWERLQNYPLIADCASVVADPVVRHLGTVVGSLCHNDPAGDWGAVALAGRAQVVIRGSGGERTVKIDDFIVDSFTTAVADGEMAMEVQFPMPGARTAGAYEKLERKVGDFATAGAAVRLTLDESGVCSDASIALTALGATPMRAPGAEAALKGQRLTEDAIRNAAAEAARAADPSADTRGSVEYKRDMAKVLVARALRRAAVRLGGLA
jgi:aerobic carbon-monoxide dehydrogenase medium subunit